MPSETMVFIRNTGTFREKWREVRGQEEEVRGGSGFTICSTAELLLVLYKSRKFLHFRVFSTDISFVNAPPVYLRLTDNNSNCFLYNKSSD